MGLSVEIGMLADLVINDSEGAGWLLDSFKGVNEVLAENALPEHKEPKVLPEFCRRSELNSFPYSFIHHLRRVYARVVNDPDWIPVEVSDGEDPARDPFVEEESMMFSSHLLCHSDAEGFYLPIDFDEVLIDETDQERIPGGLVGSSYRLLDELKEIAPKLDIKLDGNQLSDDEAKKLNELIGSEENLHIEKLVWFTLFEVTRLSIEFKTAICFS
ncbi:MAG: hypothetical protein GY714_07875 [Desulfobacterales bacterium]|nr:hypothetical protein [Desulfobacterales bacterium]MCP4158668.1 hypothetical protein [Deltaproteobacteria bacterium]